MTMTPSKELAFGLERSLNFYSSERSSPQRGFSKELIIKSDMQDEQIKEAVKDLFSPTKAISHLVISQLTQKESWQLKPLIHKKKCSLTTLCFDQSHAMTIVIVLNALLIPENKITRINLINLNQTATQHVTEYLMEKAAKVNEVGLQSLSCDAIREIFPILRDSNVTSLYLDNLQNDAVQLILDAFGSDEKNSTREIVVSSNLMLPSQLADKIKAFNNLSNVEVQTPRRSKLRPRLQGRYSNIQSPVKGSNENNKIAPKRKSYEPDSNVKTKQGRRSDKNECLQPEVDVLE